MPMYEYCCNYCRTEFDKIVPYESRDSVSCPSCNSQCVRKVSGFNWRWGNIFTKDGEGFSSVTYSPEEYKHRVRNNLGKYDKV